MSPPAKCPRGGARTSGAEHAGPCVWRPPDAFERAFLGFYGRLGWVPLGLVCRCLIANSRHAVRARRPLSPRSAVGGPPPVVALDDGSGPANHHRWPAAARQ